MNAETVKQENQEDLEKKDNKEEAVENKTADSDVEQKSNAWNKKSKRWKESLRCKVHHFFLTSKLE